MSRNKCNKNLNSDFAQFTVQTTGEKNKKNDVAWFLLVLCYKLGDIQYFDFGRMSFMDVTLWSYVQMHEE